MREFLLSILLFVVVSLRNDGFAQQQNLLKGFVLTEQNEPVEFATVYIKELDYSTYSSSKGEFTVPYPDNLLQISIRVSSIGKVTYQGQIKLPAQQDSYIIRLKASTLTLDEVTVNPLFGSTTKSNSSIVFDEEAIQRVQAFSLMDILNTIPGRATVAPNINAPQTISLRGNLGSDYDLNNSLGVAIIVDGVRQSNDANMQSRSVSQWGMNGSILGSAASSTKFDVPFQGMDLRDIPVETIERVEVIQGVAPAEYGELTDGAVIVERKAGAGPYQFTTSINGGSTNYSIGKGFKLPGTLGAANIGVNYAISNPDPRDKIEQYNRVSTSLIWSKGFGKDVKNTLSFDYNRRADDVKIDPDDDSMERSFSKNSGIRLSNRFNMKMRTALIKQLNITASYSESNQQSFKQRQLNIAPEGIGHKDTTGIYEGIIIGPSFMSVEEIIGNPITGSANVRMKTFFDLGNFTHAITYGANYNYSNNGGRGIVSDPNRPRWANQANQNARPYPFEGIPPMQNVGLFISDQFNFDLFGKKVNSNFGLRYDYQNGSGALQPRLSSRMELNRKWSIDLAYGIGTKSPTLAHRYPSPTWFDILLAMQTNGSTDALYLLYTQKFLADNSHLKASRSAQLELGLSYRGAFINSRINIYHKTNRNGFRAVKYYRNFEVPVFNVYVDEVTGQIKYDETGQMETKRGYAENRLDNVLNSNTLGFDWILSTKKIQAINTSINASTSFILGDENNDYLEATLLQEPVFINGQPVFYLLYEPTSNSTKFNLTSKLGTTTHIPKLGFVISTMLDMFWLKSTENGNEEFNYAKGYIDSQGVWKMFATKPSDVRLRTTKNIQDQNQPIIYGNFNMSVAKEIRNNLRIGITAYNVFNIQPEHTQIQDGLEITTRYNTPVSLTGSINIKF